MLNIHSLLREDQRPGSARSCPGVRQVSVSDLPNHMPVDRLGAFDCGVIGGIGSLGRRQRARRAAGDDRP